jgi:hypothetical protein
VPMVKRAALTPCCHIQDRAEAPSKPEVQTRRQAEIRAPHTLHRHAPPRDLMPPTWRLRKPAECRLQGHPLLTTTTRTLRTMIISLLYVKSGLETLFLMPNGPVEIVRSFFEDKKRCLTLCPPFSLPFSG